MIQLAPTPSSPAADLHGVRDDVRRHIRRARWRLLAGVGACSAAVVACGAVASLWLSAVGTGTCEQGDDEVVCVRREWWPLTIQQRSETWTVNGVSDGPRVEWHANGNTWLVGAYDDGLRVGPWREYWPNGVLRFSGTYVDDALSGVEAWWRPDTTPEWRIERRGGVRHGVERWFWADGSVRSEGQWVDGEKHGRFVTYDEEGAVAIVVDYLHGVPVR